MRQTTELIYNVEYKQAKCNFFHASDDSLVVEVWRGDEHLGFKMFGSAVRRLVEALDERFPAIQGEVKEPVAPGIYVNITANYDALKKMLREVQQELHGEDEDVKSVDTAYQKGRVDGYAAGFMNCAKTKVATLDEVWEAFKRGLGVRSK